jgi:hypothetical protein
VKVGSCSLLVAPYLEAKENLQKHKEARNGMVQRAETADL